MAKYTKAQVDAMTSEQYRSNLDNDSEFRIFIDGDYNSAPRQATRPSGSVRPPDAPEQAAGFDPSFDELPQPASAPAAVQPAQQPVVDTLVELPEKIHEYQPVNRAGQPIGQPQRFKYRTDAELIEQLTKAHSAATTHIRELGRNKKLEEIVSSGPTAKNFTPSTDVPKTMDELAKELLEQRQQNFLLSVREALNSFQLSVDWSKYRSQAAAESIILAVQKAGDDPTDPQSYHKAFAAMKEFIEPVAAPVTEVPAPAPAPVATAPAAPKVRTVGVSTGFSNADSTSSNDPFEVVAPTQTAGVRLTMPNGQKQVMTLADWNKQSSEFQKRVLRSSVNAAQIEALYNAADAAKAAARR